jgi:nucleotide-binding universal stress UspA family protein
MYKKILVPLDGSELAECILPHVIDIATGCGVAEIIIMTVVEPIFLVADDAGAPIDIAKLQEASVKSARSYLRRIQRKLRTKKFNVTTETLKGNAAQTISEYAARNGVDLIAMATHGRGGISRWVWGSTADKLLRSSTVPVLIVRPEACKAEIRNK